MNSTEYEFRVYVPGGNDTALVLGIEEDAAKRKLINDEIMAKHPNVEQVGFISTDANSPTLIMAGGEFCGNAARSAAWHYLEGRPGEILLRVSGARQPIKAGVSGAHEAWAQMPIDSDLSHIVEVERGVFRVALEGITHFVVNAPRSFNPEDLRDFANEILTKHDASDELAVGVIFTEQLASGLKIHPFVRVKRIGELFYETACGSGTIAVGAVMCATSGKNVNISLIQPSREAINAVVECDGERITRAVISGTIKK
jgi:diaminopimelate epimerase